MRLLSAGLIYVAVSTVVALFLGMMARGLTWGTSFVSLIAGMVGAIAVFSLTPADPARPRATEDDPLSRYRSIWLCLVGFVFALFALRSFCWLFYFDGGGMFIQSPYNLGDLGLHITYIKTFANGFPLWPDSPIYVYSKLRYPAGIDLFNGVLTNLGVDLRHQLAATGLLASLATFYAFYRWSGTFGIAGFLFNGGTVGYKFLQTFQFLDYQGVPQISWKSIALTMFVTQRGLLYAIPAGLVLLWQWRVKYGGDSELQKQKLPIWVEYILYATMPLFHVHTFLALNLVIAFLFLCRPQSTVPKTISTPPRQWPIAVVSAVNLFIRRRLPLLKLAGTALLPATFFVWLISDNFHAKSVLEWHWGWTQNLGESAMPFFSFWFVNFGVFLPLAIALVAIVAWQEWKQPRCGKFQLSIDATFLAAAVLIFLVTICVKTAPWAWDNTKILIWAYFITLPILWDRLLVRCSVPARAVTCLILFLSGFVSLIGGLAAGRPGYEFANRQETDFVSAAVRKLPIEARFAAFPTYNHPLLINGRKIVCGYGGHLWTQGIDYAAVESKLQSLMLGQGDWKETARELRVRYLFWGTQEKMKYGASSRPWEKQQPLVSKEAWGSIYDLGDGG